MSSECTRFSSANLCRVSVCAHARGVRKRACVQRGSVLALQIDKSDKDKQATTRSSSHYSPFSAPITVPQSAMR